MSAGTRTHEAAHPTASVGTRRAVERSSAPFQARKPPPPLLSPTSPVDASVIAAGGTGGTQPQHVPRSKQSRPETGPPAVARDHGPARGVRQSIGRCMYELASVVSAAAVRLTTVLCHAANGKTGVGRRYAWGPIQLATAQKTQQLPSSTENVLHGIQKPTRLAPSKPGNCATTNLRTSDLKWSSTQPSMDTALRRRV
ncbi:hypothetical protein PMIN07_011683 [Paraphaeosphaeria minitans]